MHGHPTSKIVIWYRGTTAAEQLYPYDRRPVETESGTQWRRRGHSGDDRARSSGPATRSPSSWVRQLLRQSLDQDRHRGRGVAIRVFLLKCAMIEQPVHQRRRDLGGFEGGRMVPHHGGKMVGPFIFLIT
jgi:hypothetical protein